MVRGSPDRSKSGNARRSLSGVAYLAQASLFAWEEGIVVHETIGALTNGRLLMDLTFKRNAFGGRSFGRNHHDSRPAPRRSGKRPAWGIQEGHLKRLMILTR